ncbi:hypothetical protein HOLleu_39196 [Holothuria leucospilota]|uniref:Uncharacterized protein n=1 Tax=Holothuria leucospilota TaxID=206669 RepID=A0A9Q1BE66_HOLLE|nr:hypothetical protein HOLleu_39196 [Holothuria leucospilota]
MSISEIAQGSTITFRDVTFLNSSSSSLTAFCNVIIGSENAFRMASIYPSMQVVSSTQTTSLLSEVSSTQITASETMSAPGSDISSFSPVTIVVPVIVVIGILAIIALGIVYIKLRKPVSSNEADRQNSNIYQDAVRVEENVYKTMNLDKTELGSTNHDSEVADNVAYASYDEGFKRG